MKQVELILIMKEFCVGQCTTYVVLYNQFSNDFKIYKDYSCIPRKMWTCCTSQDIWTWFILYCVLWGDNHCHARTRIFWENLLKTITSDVHCITIHSIYIKSHSVELVGLMVPCFPPGIVSTTCTISVSRNDKKIQKNVNLWRATPRAMLLSCFLFPHN